MTSGYEAMREIMCLIMCLGCLLGTVLPGYAGAKATNSGKFHSVQASHTYRGDSLDALWKHNLPKSSRDQTIPRWTSYPRKGKPQWVELDLGEERQVATFGVYWYDDGGGVQVPASWHLEARKGSEKQRHTVKVSQAGSHSVLKDQFNTVQPDGGVKARHLRIVMTPQPSATVGILSVECALQGGHVMVGIVNAPPRPSKVASRRNPNAGAAASEEDFIPASEEAFAPPAVEQAAEVEILDSGIAPEEVENRRYRDYAAECIDALMKDGTDRYGKVKSPLLVSMIDVRTRECPPLRSLPRTRGMRTPYRNWHYGEAKAPQPGQTYPPVTAVPWRGENRDTFFRPSCAEWSEEQETLAAMQALGVMTGEERYGEFVRQFVDHATKQVCKKGLFWWGSHRYVDVFADRNVSNGGHHELQCKRPNWDLIWEINPEATRKHIEAMWEWHVYDKKTGGFDRHSARKKDHAFASAGALLVHAMAFLGQQPGLSEYTDRAALVESYHWNRRNPETGLFPSDPDYAGVRWDGDYCTTMEIGQYCYFLLKAYEISGREVFRDHALAYMKAYAKYAWDPKARKFYGAVRVTDGKPAVCSRRQPNYKCQLPSGHLDLWEPYNLGWEWPLAAAQNYAYAYTLTGDKELLEAARNWATFINENPPETGCRVDSWTELYARLFSKYGTFAEFYGKSISFFVTMYANTGEQAYLDDARRFAQEAVSKLYYKGLFRGHPARPYYVSTDGVGYLLVSLLQLDRAIELKGKLVGQKTIPLAGEGTLGFDNW